MKKQNEGKRVKNRREKGKRTKGESWLNSDAQNHTKNAVSMR